MKIEEFINKYLNKKIDYDNAFGPQCFMPGTRVLMADNSYKAIEDIKIGDKVKNYEGGFNIVEEVYTRKTEVVKVRTNIADLYVTPDHPFLAKDGYFYPITKFEKNNEEFWLYQDYEFNKTDLTKEELLFLGFWLGDGTLTRHKGNRKPEIKIIFGEKKKPFIESLNILKHIKKHHNCDNAYVGSISIVKHKKLADIIFDCYDETGNKVLRRNFNNKEWKYIIEGYIKADGSKKNNSFVITGTSKELLLTIQRKAIQIGYKTASLRLSSKAGTPTTILDVQTKKRKHIIRKKNIYKLTLAKPKKKRGFINRIINIEELGEQTVYNLQTSNNHTFIAENFVVHNCVDLIRQYIKEVLNVPQIPVVTGAYQLFDKADPQYFEKIENTPSGVPQKGDIVVWKKCNWLPYGHAAIFLEGDVNKFISLDQNWPSGQGVSRVRHSYKAVRGWLRPKILNDGQVTLDSDKFEELVKKSDFADYVTAKLNIGISKEDFDRKMEAIKNKLDECSNTISAKDEEIKKLRLEVKEKEEVVKNIKDEVKKEIEKYELLLEQIKRLLLVNEDAEIVPNIKKTLEANDELEKTIARLKKENEQLKQGLDNSEDYINKELLRLKNEINELENKFLNELDIEKTRINNALKLVKVHDIASKKSSFWDKIFFWKK